MQKDHDQVLELLPWYVNETLAGREQELVLRHLAECRGCQEERDRLYQLQQMVQETDTPVPDHALSFRRVMRRIDDAERNRESTADVTPAARRSWWIPAGVAASVFSLVVAGSAWLGIDNRQGAAPVEEAYQALSSDVPVPGMTRRIELGFVSPIPAATMRQALVETNSNIVSGPDESGNYLVEVVVPSGVSPADFLAGLQRIQGVERARFISE